MSISEGSETLAQLKRALVAIKDLRGKLDSVERARTEPIAIIGMGCRVPGADNPSTFWQLLRDGVDAISETPTERWDATLYNADPEANGKVATRWGGFLRDIDRFDPAFFGISPREATAMDPQQRILLEVAYETFEDAGQTTEALAGSKTGVFIGVHSHSSDYYLLQAADPATIDTYSGTGTSHSVVAGRISYLFDLQGPSVALDTACSSSLVAVHQAVQSLRSAECRMALAGGVNIILEPTFTIAASRMRMLAADGRCKTFDAAADGFVRAEGCATVLLKRLSDAIADGDRVLAVVYGSAVNQDGHTNGLTAPNGLSQQTVIRAALANAGVQPQQISYFEAHGTGTPLGDPIEVEALAAIMGASTAPEHVCALGSAKANVGHTEGAAGVVGLIKAVLSLQHEAIPPLVHFQELNPHITLDNPPFVIPTALHPWSAGESPRYAGVSSFGWSGTNAHVIVGDAPRSSIVPAPAVVEESTCLLPLSARSPEALRGLAERYHTFLLAEQAGLRDICFSAATRRSHHDHRLALVGANRAELAEQLAAFLEGQARTGMTTSRVDTNQSPGVVFVFPGQGAQWFGMGRGLLATVPAFREAMERCDAAIRAEAGWSPLEQLAADKDHSRLNEIDVIQPTLFAIQVSLAALWRTYGIVPDAVVGHSMGEVAAAHVAGILNLEDATRVICRRSRLLRRVRGQGAMAVVELSVHEAHEAIAGYENRLAIAVNNSPNSTVLSGDPAALDEVLAHLQKRDVFCRHVKVDVASHSPQMDPLRDDLLSALAELHPQASATPFYSTVTGAIEDGADCDARYWVRNLRQPVLFATATRQLVEDGMSIFVEISPHPLLLQAIDTTCQHNGHHSITVASLQRNADEYASILGSLGALYAHGYPVDWRTLYAQGNFVPLPSYPWQHEQFWLRQDAQPTGGRRGTPAHPLLGWQVALAEGDGTVWENDLRKVDRPELYDHRIDGVPVLPASAYLEFATAAAALLGDEPYELANIAFERALFLDDDAATLIQIVLAPDQGGHSLHIYSHNDERWMLHASLTIRPIQQPNEQPDILEQLDLIRARARTTLDRDALYAGLEAMGVKLGHSLQRVEQVWRGDGEALGYIAGPENGVYQPLNLDACLQITALAIDRDDAIFMPTALTRVRLYAAPTGRMWCYVRTHDQRNDDYVVQDITLRSADGQRIATIEGLRLQRLGAHTDSLDRWLYQFQWRRDNRPAPREVVRAGEHWLIFADRTGVGAALASQLRAAGAEYVLAYAGSDYEQTAEASFTIRPHAPEDVQRLLNEALGETICTGVMHLWSLDTPTGDDLAAATLETAQEVGCGSVLHLVQAFPDRDDTPRLWLVTRGAQHTVDSDRDVAVAQAPLWGFGRVVAEEHPELWGGLIDLDMTADGDHAAALLADEIKRQDGEDQVALRGNERYLARLVRRPPAPPTAFRWRADASYLLTGGFGALGAQVARWMVRQGARRLILMSRTVLPPRMQWHQFTPDSLQGQRIALVRELERQGASVHLAAVDVSDETQLRAFLDTFRAEGWPPIRGVIHTAAVFESQLLRQHNLASFKALMRPKFVGAWLLNQLLDDLDMFVLFSSLAALLPQEGQGDYAAANAALDALAEQRRLRGQPGVSINWGVWSEVGLIEASAWQQRVDQMAAQGIARFSTERGLEALGQLIDVDQAQVVVVPADWAAFGASRAQARTYPLLTDLFAEATASTSASHTDAERSLRTQLSGAASDERRTMLEAHVQGVIAQVLKMPPTRIDPTRPLGTLGVDSLMAVEIRNRLGSDLGLKLSATMIWNYPTVTDLTNHLLSKLSFTPDIRTAPESSLTSTIQPLTERASAPLEQLVSDIDELSEDAALLALLGKH